MSKSVLFINFILVTFLCASESVSESTCYDCDSKVLELCEDNPEAISDKTCVQGHHNGQLTGCYVKRYGYVRRGCVVDLAEAEVTSCQNSRSCKICSGNNCNTRGEFHKCFICKGKYDPNCPKKQHTAKYVTESDGSEVCKDYDSRCITEIDPAGYTNRYCTTQTTKSSKDFHICEGINCNNEMFPTNRLGCYQCDSRRDSNCRYSVEHMRPEPCVVYDENDQCFTYVTKDKYGSDVVYRGCLSDGSNARLLCQSNDQKGNCTICSGVGCNT